MNLVFATTLRQNQILLSVEGWAQESATPSDEGTAFRNMLHLTLITTSSACETHCRPTLLLDQGHHIKSLEKNCTSSRAPHSITTTQTGDLCRLTSTSRKHTDISRRSHTVIGHNLTAKLEKDCWRRTICLMSTVVHTCLSRSLTIWTPYCSMAYFVTVSESSGTTSHARVGPYCLDTLTLHLERESLVQHDPNATLSAGI